MKRGRIMKKILLCFVLFIIVSDISPAFDYTEEDKNLFYDSFTEGYIEQITKAVQAAEIDDNKKNKFISEFPKIIDRNELINSSWECIKKYPINEIVQASITCTAGWTQNQTEKNKALFNAIK